MDFIERIFGFAPDGGSGSLEFLLFAIPLAGIGYLFMKRRQRARRRPWPTKQVRLIEILSAFASSYSLW
jgi:hypothetical protein